MSYLPVVRHLRSRDGTAIYAEGIGNPHHPHLILAHGLGLSSAALNNLFTDKRLLENVYLVRLRAMHSDDEDRTDGLAIRCDMTCVGTGGAVCLATQRPTSRRVGRRIMLRWCMRSN